MKEEKIIRGVFRVSETEAEFLRPYRQQKHLSRIAVRVHRTGMENPRFRLEAPETWVTLETRQRQLHDEGKSCGIQPAYIRMIYRRFSSCALPRIYDLNKKAA